MDRDYTSSEDLTDIEYLQHYGIPRRSGRYQWGSGDDSYQRTGDFLTRIDTLKKQGLSQKDIADSFGIKTTQLRTQESLAKAERRSELVDRAVALKAKGMSPTAIAREMGYPNESSVRSLLNAKSIQRMDEAQNVAATLKKHVDEKGMIDIGAGVERELTTSKEKMNQATYMLELEGYKVYSGGVAQVTNAGKQTTIKVLCKPGTEHKEIYDTTKVFTIKDYNTATGEAKTKAMQYPESLDSKRISIRYAEDGGTSKDGTIEIRRGVADLNLGNSHYAQVRILTDGTHYLKGMAVYKDDSNFPKGVDVVFNTNKGKGTPQEKVFKPIKDDDPVNPFGSSIKENGQTTYIDKKTGKEKLSPINKAREEGDWNDWSLGLPSQFLAKQSKALITKQLSLSKADKLADLDEILKLDNPTVKKKLLADFAEDADAAAVHLKAAALPRQKYQVILPIDSMKDNEVFAPNFKDGEKVALVRFPHGGTFEIPILTVNNKNKDAVNMVTKGAKDAICINSKNAERLSGADFDGDTVLVLPTSPKVKITNQKELEGLKGFDNKKEYPAKEGMRYLTKANVGREMGVISNLITDMTLKGANNDELTRAVKHSMVVIDAEKHKLDFKKSERDNGIQALKNRYQSNDDSGKGGGASTILSQAKGTERVDKRVGTPKVNIKGKDYYDPTKPEGALIYKSVRETYIDKNGKEQVRTIKSTKMAETNDARKLMSKNPAPQEELYADYANSLKAMANTARKALVTTPNLKYSPEAKKEYAKEVDTLKAKLNISLLNAPRERQAQLLANAIVKEQKQSNPNMEPEQIKKLNTRALNTARDRFGASRTPIDITDREWEAIQKGAITENVLTQILHNADIDSLRSKATPRTYNNLSVAKLNTLQAMKASGYTNAEIASRLGISASEVAKY